MSYLGIGLNQGTGVWSGDYVGDGMGLIIDKPAAPARMITTHAGGGGKSMSLPKRQKVVAYRPGWQLESYYKGWQIQKCPTRSGMLYRAVRGPQRSRPASQQDTYRWVDRIASAPRTTQTRNRPIILKRRAVTVQTRPPV